MLESYLNSGDAARWIQDSVAGETTSLVATSVVALVSIVSTLCAT